MRGLKVFLASFAAFGVWTLSVDQWGARERAPADVASPCGETAESLAVWRNQSIDDLVGFARVGYDNSDFKQLAKRALAVTRDLARCKEETPSLFAPAMPAAKCFARLDAFARELSYAAISGHAMGFRISTADYVNLAKQKAQVPPVLRDPQFLSNVSDWPTLPLAKEYLREINDRLPAAKKMIFFSYQSQHLGTPEDPNVRGRLLVVIPGDPENWVQFGIRNPADPKPSRNISVVSIHSTPTGKKEVYLTDNFRTYLPNGFVGNIRHRFDENGSTDNCMGCHMNPVLPIFPRPGSVEESEKDLVKKVNERWEDYGEMTFGSLDGLPLFDKTAMGPGLAQREDKPSADFVARCISDAGFPELAEVDASVAKVRSAMNCSECHASGEFGPLNLPLSKLIIDSYVHGKRMPPAKKLSDAESQALTVCLLSEYFGTPADKHEGLLRKWLTEISCGP